MGVEKLKKKLQMREMLETEIKDCMEELSNKAVEILIKDDDIFNGEKLNPTLLKDRIIFGVKPALDFEILKELDMKLKPNKILLTGHGYGSIFANQKSQGHVRVELIFGD